MTEFVHELVEFYSNYKEKWKMGFTSQMLSLPVDVICNINARFIHRIQTCSKIKSITSRFKHLVLSLALMFTDSSYWWREFSRKASIYRVTLEDGLAYGRHATIKKKLNKILPGFK